MNFCQVEFGLRSASEATARGGYTSFEVSLNGVIFTASPKCSRNVCATTGIFGGM